MAAKRAAATAVGPRTVLFVGDSLTYVNDLDERVAKLAAASGRTIHVERVVKGGAPLSKLWRKTNAKKVIAGGVGWNAESPPVPREPWDVVIIQEDLPETDKATFRMFANKFCQAVLAAGSSTVLLAMWPYERLGWVNTEGIAAAHEEVAAAVAGGRPRVAHAGRAWAEARARLPDLELYAGDLEHPTPAGTALAAAVVFTTLWGGEETPLVPVPPRLPMLKSEVSMEQLKVLHRIAFEIACEGGGSEAKSEPEDSGGSASVAATTPEQVALAATPSLERAAVAMSPASSSWLPNGLVTTCCGARTK